MPSRSILQDARQMKPFLRVPVTDLPTLPVVAMKLLKLTRDDAASVDDLLKVIETDPAIAMKVLRIVNSAAYGLRQKVSSVKHAVILLGFQAIRTLAVEVTLFEQVMRRRHSFDRVYFWRHCLAVAGLAELLARQTGLADPEEAHTAGLLHDIGKIASEMCAKVGYGEILARHDKFDGPLLEIEKRLCGVSHDELGGHVCAEWDLPDPVVLAVRFHHERFEPYGFTPAVNALIAIVALANFMTWLLGLGSVQVMKHSVLAPEVERIIPLGDLDLQGLVDRMNREVANVAEFYEFAFPSPEQFRRNLLMANLHLGRYNTKYFYGQQSLQDKIDFLKKIRKSLVLPHRSLNPTEIIPMTLQAVQQDFGYDRVSLFLIDTARRCLVLRHELNTPRVCQPRNLEIPITSSCTGVIECLRDRIPVVMRGRTAGEREALAMLETDEMGLVPVVGAHQIIGILGVDQHWSGRPVLLEDLATVASIASELGLALDNARMFDEARTLAFRDGMTKVHNRAYLNMALDQKVRQARERQGRLAIGLVDVDFFKQFNDRFGHLTGDLVLKLLAATLKKVSRPLDIIGRYGGEEFMFLLDNAGLADAVLYAERLRTEVGSLGRTLQKRFPGRPLSISVGVAELKPGMSGVEELVRKADQALYLAKGSGRDAVRTADQVDETGGAANV